MSTDSQRAAAAIDLSGDEETQLATAADLAQFAPIAPTDGDHRARTLQELLGDALCKRFMVLQGFMVDGVTFDRDDFFDLRQMALPGEATRYFMSRGIGEPMEVDLTIMQPIVVAEVKL